MSAKRQVRPAPLPAAYFAQLSVSNGGEGDLGVEPGWIALWRCEEVVPSNAGYSLPKFLPGFFGFGSNGGGELLAFDLRGEEPYPIVTVPFVPMDPKDAVRIARSFQELRDLIGRSMSPLLQRT
jgi:hypothetical protein